MISCGFCSEGSPVPLGASDRLRYFYCDTPLAIHVIMLKFSAVN